MGHPSQGSGKGVRLPDTAEISLNDEDLKRALERVLAPLVEADSGELYWVPGPSGSESSPQVRLHLRGRFAGCPGNNLVTEHIIRPLVRTAVPTGQVQVSSGAILPEGAERVVSKGGF